MLDSVGGRLSGVGPPITAALAPMHRDTGGGRNVEEGKLPVGLYAKVFTVGPPELAAKPD
jgi:hypothetical protein